MECMSISVYGYTNYRAFLSEWFADKKNKNRGFSQRLFSRKAGFSSPNVLSMVLLGKRNLSLEAVQKIAEYIGFNTRETQYFEHLVQFNQAGDDAERHRHFEKICFFKAFQQIKSIDYKHYSYFSKWYIPVIREMMFLPEFDEDVDWLQNALGEDITADEIREALNLIETLGFAIRDKNGKLIPHDAVIQSDNDVASVSLYAFHLEMIKKSFEALKNQGLEFREISALTLPLDAKRFASLRDKLRAIREEYAMESADIKKPCAIFQFNFQIFNLTKAEK